MVYAVVRHAARNVLPKSANLTESEATGGPALLPQGRVQASTAGVCAKQVSASNMYVMESLCSPCSTALCNTQHSRVCSLHPPTCRRRLPPAIHCSIHLQPAGGAVPYSSGPQ